MDEKNCINDFFINLSRFETENALSDIIAATCNTCFQFKKLFLEFVFSNKDLNTKCPTEIEREVWSDDNKFRFDFYFTTTDNEKYVIENKIYDPHDHFEDYTKDLTEDHIGFIANYNVIEKKYTHTHTWKEFYNFIKLKRNEFTKDELLLVDGVLQYIQEGCGIMEERNFNLSSVKDLRYFIKALENMLQKHNFEINRKARGSSEERLGFWCYKKNSYWFGLYLHDELNDGFSIWSGIYNYKMKETKYEKLEYSVYHDDDTSENCNWFKLKDNYLNKLSDESIEYTEKLKILEDFILEIESIK